MAYWYKVFLVLLDHLGNIPVFCTSSGPCQHPEGWRTCWPDYLEKTTLFSCPEATSCILLMAKIDFWFNIIFSAVK